MFTGEGNVSIRYPARLKVEILVTLTRFTDRPHLCVCHSARSLSQNLGSLMSKVQSLQSDNGAAGADWRLRQPALFSGRKIKLGKVCGGSGRGGGSERGGKHHFCQVGPLRELSRLGEEGWNLLSW